MKDKHIVISLITGFAEGAKLSEIKHALSLEGYYVVDEPDWEAYQLWLSELDNHDCKEYKEQQ